MVPTPRRRRRRRARPGRLTALHLVSARAKDLLPAVRDLTFDPSLRATEVTSAAWSLLQTSETQAATWTWEKENFDRLLAAVPQHHGQTQLIEMASVFCDQAHAKDAEAFFTPARIAKIEGGPRVLASTLEGLHLCIAKRAKQESSARELFAARARR